MSTEAKSYAIYSLKSGQLVAKIGPDGAVHDAGNREAVAVLKALLQRDITIREQQIDYDPQQADEEFDPFPEENMCYFGVVTLRPGDPSYLKTFLRRLPYISHYEARPMDIPAGAAEPEQDGTKEIDVHQQEV